MKRLIFLLFRKITNALSRKGLRRIPGVASVWLLIYKTVTPKGITLITCQDSKMYVNADYGHGGLGPLLLLEGTYEGYETELFKKLVEPGMVIVDIGANIGYYSLIAAKLVGGSGRVYAFEPEPDNYELLVKSIRVNGYHHIAPLQKAVSNKSGKIKLFIDKFSPCHPAFSEQNLIEKAGFINVETVTLDDFFEGSAKDNRVDLIKMDAQGAEGFIVDGAQKVLERNNLKILMEFWPYGLKNVGTDPLELLLKLQAHSFKIKVLDGTNRCMKDVEVTKVIETCEGKDDGKGYVNLLLEK